MKLPLTVINFLVLEVVSDFCCAPRSSKLPCTKHMAQQIVHNFQKFEPYSNVQMQEEEEEKRKKKRRKERRRKKRRRKKKGRKKKR